MGPSTAECLARGGLAGSVDEDLTLPAPRALAGPAGVRFTGVDPALLWAPEEVGLPNGRLDFDAGRRVPGLAGTGGCAPSTGRVVVPSDAFAPRLRSEAAGADASGGTSGNWCAAGCWPLSERSLADGDGNGTDWRSASRS
jgi:hypothetical protein